MQPSLEFMHVDMKSLQRAAKFVQHQDEKGEYEYITYTVYTVYFFIDFFKIHSCFNNYISFS